MFEDVGLKTLDPRVSLIREMLSQNQLAKWLEQYQTFTYVEKVLHRRQESGFPVKLVLRRGSFDADVVERLRPLVDALEIDPSCMPLAVPPDGDTDRASRGRRV